MNVAAVFNLVKAFVFDIDGVLTNGNIILMPDGSQVRTMNIKDGYALQLAVKMNYPIFIISGANNKEAMLRLQKLGITEIFINCENKESQLEKLLIKYNITYADILFMGDDMPDIQLMQLVGLPTCPADAAQDIINCAKYISPKNGGEGAVRDVIEKVLKLQNNWILDLKISSK